MYYPRILILALIAMTFASSCKKDDNGDEQLDTTCTETREFWLDGSTNGQAFVTSEPCGNLRLSEVAVNNASQGGPELFVFNSKQTIEDSTGNSVDTFSLFISAYVDTDLVDTIIEAGDTTYSMSANNICNAMALGKHYLYTYEARQNNTNAFYVQYTDGNGIVWTPISAPVTDSTFVVTSIDGIVSQNPFSGAYFPYCTISFSYDMLMVQQPPTADTLYLKGTGRIGFR